MAWPIVAIAAGTGLQLFGQYKESKARSAALNRQADLDQMRANELLQRTEINNSLLATETNRAASAVRARGTRSVDTAGVLENVARDLTKQIELNNRDAQFEASMIRMGADTSRAQAKDERRAGRIGMLGTLIGAAGNLA